MMVTALVYYRNTPMDEPATRGLYRISRNPQWVALIVLLLGICIAVGPWTAVISAVGSMVLGHFRIIAEEQACLDQYGEAYAAYIWTGSSGILCFSEPSPFYPSHVRISGGKR
jgi:protein-S-isoprenylcysteine O-methyltransferase Ste14